MNRFHPKKYYGFQIDSITLCPMAEIFQIADGLIFAYIGWCQPLGCSFNPFELIHKKDLHKVIEIKEGSLQALTIQEWRDEKALIGEKASTERCLQEVQKLYPAAKCL